MMILLISSRQQRLPRVIHLVSSKSPQYFKEKSMISDEDIKDEEEKNGSD